jgi:uncharacterized ferredoxin-like protein
MSKNIERMPATESDVDAGSAAFWIPDQRSNVYDLGVALPAAAVAAKNIRIDENEEIPAGTPITIIQAEIVDETDVVVGFRYDGGVGVCSLDEVVIRAPAQS